MTADVRRRSAIGHVSRPTSRSNKEKKRNEWTKQKFEAAAEEAKKAAHDAKGPP